MQFLQKKSKVWFIHVMQIQIQQSLLIAFVLWKKADAGLAFASGMAAVFASFASYIKSGDHIVSSRAIFGSTHQLITQLFPRWGVTYTYVETPNIEDWEKAIQSNTKIVFLESPSNPGLELFDLEALAKLKEKHPNVIFAIDNCFATPYLQQPLQFGFDLSIHSATKYMDGQGRVLGGVVVGKEELINEMMFLFVIQVRRCRLLMRGQFLKV